MKKIVFSSLCGVFFIIPFFADAAVVINEVMYDVEGTDTGREWIEVHNAGASGIDLATWKLFEADTNHGLTATGASTIAPGGYAVIADNTEKFLADHPGFSGVLFDSAFSLNNSGETLTLRDGNGADQDSVTYDVSKGAAGDGTSLQKTASGWIAAGQTPGAVNASVATSPADQTENENTPPAVGTSNTSSGKVSSAPVVKGKISADAGGDRTVIVAADTPYEGEAYGLDGKPLPNARFVWNFGDGKVEEGKRVLHRYDFPGEYIVILTIASGEYSAVDRITVNAVPANLSISFADATRIDIENDTDTEVDLGRWYVSGGGVSFAFPEGTIVPPGKRLILSSATTGIIDVAGLVLYYPNSRAAASWNQVGVIADQLAAPAASSGEASIFSATKKIASSPSNISVGIIAAKAHEGSDAGTATSSSTTPATGTSHEVLAAAGASGAYAWLPWILGLLALIGAGSTAVFLMRRTPEDEFEITE